MPEDNPRQYDLVWASADYGEWRGPPSRSLLICTQQRSGSTLLGEAIYFYGGLGCPLEYFHAGFRPAFARRWKSNDIKTYAEMAHRFRTDPSGVFSVKLFWWDVVALVRELAPAEFAWLSRATASRLDASIYRRMFAMIAAFFPSPTVVFLTRREEINQAVSTYVAGQTRNWRQFSKRKSAPRVAYDFDGIVQRLAEIQNDNRHWLNFFRANGLQYHSMTYEDLADDYAATLKRLFAALGRPDAPIPAPRLQKQADDATTETLLLQFRAEFHNRTRG